MLQLAEIPPPDSDLERGTREPGLRTLHKITGALGTTPSERLKGL